MRCKQKGADGQVIPSLPQPDSTPNASQPKSNMDETKKNLTECETERIDAATLCDSLPNLSIVKKEKFSDSMEEPPEPAETSPPEPLSEKFDEEETEKEKEEAQVEKPAPQDSNKKQYIIPIVAIIKQSFDEDLQQCVVNVDPPHSRKIDDISFMSPGKFSEIATVDQVLMSRLLNLIKIV